MFKFIKKFVSNYKARKLESQKKARRKHLAEIKNNPEKRERFRKRYVKLLKQAKVGKFGAKGPSKELKEIREDPKKRKKLAVQYRKVAEEVRKRDGTKTRIVKTAIMDQKGKTVIIDTIKPYTEGNGEDYSADKIDWDDVKEETNAEIPKFKDRPGKGYIK